MGAPQHPDVVVHLPSGPVAGRLVGRSVDVAGVILARASHRGVLLPGDLPRVARFEDYRPGALNAEGA